MFCYCETKKTNEKLWYSTPFLSTKNFHIWLFLNHRGLPLRNVAVLWDKKFRQKIMLLPPTSSLKFFETSKFLQLRSVTPKKVSVLWCDKFPHPGSWYAPHFLLPIFSDKWKLLKHRKVPLRNVSVLWDKKFRQKIMLLPPTSSLKFFETSKFLQLRSVTPKKVSVLWCDKFPHPGSWYAPHFLLPIFSDKWKLLKHRKVPLRNVSVLWDRTIWTEIRDRRPHSFYPWSFPIRKL